jgi:hypothetical protein
MYYRINNVICRVVSLDFWSVGHSWPPPHHFTPHAKTKNISATLPPRNAGAYVRSLLNPTPLRAPVPVSGAPPFPAPAPRIVAVSPWFLSFPVQNQLRLSLVDSHRAMVTPTRQIDLEARGQPWLGCSSDLREAAWHRGPHWRACFVTMEPEPEPEPEPELKRLVSDVSTGIEKAASAVGESASTLISGAVDATVGMLGREEADTQLPGGVPIRPKLAPSMSASLEASVDPGRLGSFKLRTRSDAQPELRSGLHKGRNTPLSGTHPVYKGRQEPRDGGRRRARPRVQRSH